MSLKWFMRLLSERAELMIVIKIPCFFFWVFTTTNVISLNKRTVSDGLPGENLIRTATTERKMGGRIEWEYGGEDHDGGTEENEFPDEKMFVIDAEYVQHIENQ
ncbi:hypothetical protein AB6A40_003368 [Gnathostoma spinigerum]|uniref:Uncharacterized protein n=1 Tax=Gnathostoma spinigerum TaxID=75299 RepID=A0ABD6EEW7_9BILA